MTQLSEKSQKLPIKLLIVDDSRVLRRVLCGTLSQRDDIEIIGEATNGVEALELILNLSPDVILLDVEMPVMDGMTTLQHLMIHTPTPVIMLSSLSKWGSSRCLDALKYGAVDFISKDSFFKGIDGTAHSKMVIRKVLAAAGIKVNSIDPMQSPVNKTIKACGQVVFCEECGTRNSAKNPLKGVRFILCKNCGDEIPLVLDHRYRRMNYLTVIGTGASGYGNLLKIIPALTPDMGGAIFIMALDARKNVESFVNYLDSISNMQVEMGTNGATVEGGGCYFFSGEQNVTLSPYSGAYSLKIKKLDDDSEEIAIDSLMASVASILGDRVQGVLLSGYTADGSQGMKEIEKNNGKVMILNPDRCLHKIMVTEPRISQNLNTNLDEAGLADMIRQNHFLNKENVVTA